MNTLYINASVSSDLWFIDRSKMFTVFFFIQRKNSIFAQNKSKRQTNCWSCFWRWLDYIQIVVGQYWWNNALHVMQTLQQSQIATNIRTGRDRQTDREKHQTRESKHTINLNKNERPLMLRANTISIHFNPYQFILFSIFSHNTKIDEVAQRFFSDCLEMQAKINK